MNFIIIYKNGGDILKIIYWSGTGNTEKMAEFIAKGIKESGKDSEVITVSNVNIDYILQEDILVLGCPAMGAEELESVEFEPFLESISDKVSGKKAVLFGSYGWGNGEWMDEFKEKVLSFGCTIPIEPLIVQYEPEEDQCIEFGKSISKL